MSKRILQLFTGGYDSTYLLIENLKKGYIVQPLYIEVQGLGRNKIEAETEAILRIYEELQPIYKDQLQRPEFYFSVDHKFTSNYMKKKQDLIIKSNKLKRKIATKKEGKSSIIQHEQKSMCFTNIHRKTFKEFVDDNKLCTLFSYHTNNVHSAQPICWILGLFSYINRKDYYGVKNEYDEIHFSYIMNDDTISYISEMKKLYSVLSSFTITKIAQPKLVFPLIKMSKQEILSKAMHSNYTIFDFCHTCEDPVYDKTSETWKFCGNCIPCTRLIAAGFSRNNNKFIEIKKEDCVGVAAAGIAGCDEQSSPSES
jgi:7-cyano-7-deazaguanine synthase in queuosine biosynthesis